MKKSLIAGISVVLLLITLVVGASAAGFDGAIWTGKPTILGLGYYCTAAQNRSASGTNRCSYAESKNSSGKIIASDSKSGDKGTDRSVANSGATKPNSGYGWYKETGGFADMSFNSYAYD